MRSKSTSAQGKEHEEYVELVFEWDDAKRSRSSGASFHDPIDITSDHFVIECESTEKGGGYAKLFHLWKEVQEKQHSGRRPALAIRFRDVQNGHHLDLLVTDLHDASEAFETHDNV
jgi:hypothetical protein